MAGESSGEAAFKLAFQLSPIILTGGIADKFLSGYLPIIAITELINFPAGLLSGMQADLDNFFAHFRPMAGSTILEQEIGHYPFANQAVAANAIIASPRNVALEMLIPAKTKFGFYERLAIMEALEGTLDLHTQLGGAYIVITPVKIYTSCLLKAIRDTSSSQRTGQPQISWQWEFEQPLLTSSDLGGALNSLYDWITRGTEVPQDALPSGIPITTSTPPALSTNAGMPVASSLGNTIDSGLGKAIGLGPPSNLPVGFPAGSPFN
jgi:hypothetical protein